LGLKSAGESKLLLHEFEADAHGRATFTLDSDNFSLEHIVGRAVMIHDDPNKNHDDVSNYIAVGVVARAGACLLVPDKQ
jgi:hypothetical protein